jgi:hypothetical protein
MHPVADQHDTSLNWSARDTRAIDQRLPFQWALCEPPTAVQPVGDVHDTPARKSVRAFGVRSIDQRLLFQRSTSALR